MLYPVHRCNPRATSVPRTASAAVFAAELAPELCGSWDRCCWDHPARKHHRVVQLLQCTIVERTRRHVPGYGTRRRRFTHGVYWRRVAPGTIYHTQAPGTIHSHLCPRCTLYGFWCSSFLFGGPTVQVYPFRSWPNENPTRKNRMNSQNW